jgi:hypothetical protein
MTHEQYIAASYAVTFIVLGLMLAASLLKWQKAKKL